MLAVGSRISSNGYNNCNFAGVTSQVPMSEEMRITSSRISTMLAKQATANTNGADRKQPFAPKKIKLKCR